MQTVFTVSMVTALAAFGSVQVASAQTVMFNVRDAQLVCQVTPLECAAQLKALISRITGAGAGLTDARQNALLGQIATVATQIAQANPQLRTSLGSVVAEAAQLSTDPVQRSALARLVEMFKTPSVSLSTVSLAAVAGSPS